MILLSIFVLFLDQLTKFFALKKLAYGVSIPVIGNFFCLTLVANSGSAFGLFKSLTFILIIITSVAIAVILRYVISKRPVDSLIRLSLFLILGGALGNLIDRVRFGFVVDFLDFGINSLRWPAFNVADSAITIGAILLGWKIITTQKKSE